MNDDVIEMDDGDDVIERDDGDDVHIHITLFCLVL
jgi:hypothetical protein